MALIPPSFQPFGLLKFRNLVIERRLVRFIRLHRNRRFVAKKNRFQKASSIYCKVHIFWEGHKFLQNLNCRFVLCSNCQISCGDFAKFCGLLRIYELYGTLSIGNLMFICQFFFIKFIFSEKATKFWEISTVDLTVIT